MYLLILTLDTWLMFIIFEKDISFTEFSESDSINDKNNLYLPRLPFKLSHYYAYCRESLNNWRKEFVAWMVIAILTSFITMGIY
jgi:hypothetical protein